MIVIPPLNKKFKVTYPRFPETLEASLIKVRPGSDPFRKYTILRTKWTGMYGDVNDLPIKFEVDADWFDEEKTERKITLL